FGFALHAGERFEIGAIATEERRGGAGDVTDVIKPPSEVGGIVAGQHGAQHIRRGEQLARKEYPLDRCLALPECALDAAAPRRQVLLARRRLRGERRAGEREQEGARQTLALPCAETAATRRATSAASPR